MASRFFSVSIDVASLSVTRVALCSYAA